MDFYNKYLKYKNKYLFFKELKCHVDQMINSNVVGKGSFGFVVLPKENDEIIYKILMNEDCDNLKKEHNIQEEMYITMLKNMPVTEIAYIPRPICFYQLKRPIEYIYNQEKYSVSCIFGMENMKVIECDGVNQYQGEYYQLHLGENDENESGFRKGREQQGYFIGEYNELQKILTLLKNKYKKVPTCEEIYETIGYFFALSWFICNYYPIDIQFMLSEFDNEIKVVCFDFEKYTKNNNTKYIYNIDEEGNIRIIEKIEMEIKENEMYIKENIEFVVGYIFGRSRYLSPLLNNFQSYDPFLEGMKKIVTFIGNDNINKAYEDFINLLL
jgi:hypothetical protein